MKEDSYLNSGRLADVLTLIQILAYDVSARRSSDGLNKQLSRSPLSATDWFALGRLHPEFFRVLEGKPGQPKSISLVARFVLEPVASTPGAEPKTPALSADITSNLMDLAVQLHDREMQRRDRWKAVLVPTIVAILAATASIIAAVISTAKGRDAAVSTQTNTPYVTSSPTPGAH
jgi:hypothetical protein